MQVGGPGVGSLAPQAEGEHALGAARLSRRQDAVGVVGVEVDHRAAALLEDLQLGGEVILEVLVLDGADVVEADVQKAPDGEVDAVGAVVLERLARDLHHKAAEARVSGVGQVAPQVGALGSRVARRAVLNAVVGLDGADDAAAAGPARMVEDRSEHVGAGRLALGAGDADDGQVAVGASRGGGGGDGHGTSQLACGHGEGGKARFGASELAELVRSSQVGDGAGLACRGQKRRPKRRALAHKEVACADSARVACGARDGGVRVPVDLAGDVVRAQLARQLR